MTDLSPLEKRLLKQIPRNEPIAVGQVFLKMDAELEEMNAALYKLKTQGHVFEPKNNQVMRI